MKKLFSIALAFALALAPMATMASYGGSSSIGSSLTRDNCPGGDFSISYYDGTCDSGNAEEEASGVTLDGYIYFDENENGNFDGSETGVQGAVVTLKTPSNSILDTDVTSSAGYYSFLNVAAGVYKIHVSIPRNLTVLETVLAALIPSVNAQTDYEFTVVVGEEETGTKTLGTTPVVDGVINGSTDSGNGVSSVNDDNTTTTNIPAPTVDEEDESDDDVKSILDLIKDANEDNSPSVTSSINTTTTNNGGGFVLPTSLPNTGASL